MGVSQRTLRNHPTERLSNKMERALLCPAKKFKKHDDVFCHPTSSVDLKFQRMWGETIHQPGVELPSLSIEPTSMGPLACHCSQRLYCRIQGLSTVVIDRSVLLVQTKC